MSPIELSWTAKKMTSLVCIHSNTLRQIFLKIEWQNQQSYIGLSLFDFKQHLLNNRDIVQLWLENNLSKSKIGFFAQLHWEAKTAPGPLTLVKGKAKIADRTTCTFERDRARRYNRGCEIHTDRVLQCRGGSEWIQEKSNFVASLKSGYCCYIAGQMQPMLLF